MAGSEMFRQVLEQNRFADELWPYDRNVIRRRFGEVAAKLLEKLRPAPHRDWLRA
jgi:hypothetical protein